MWGKFATRSIINAATDESWSEMATKVIARHPVGDALGAAVLLQDDQVTRVRNAAGRAVERLVDERK